VKQVVIENPVINSPFREPDRHFRFTDEGITNEVIEVADPRDAMTAIRSLLESKP